MEESGLLSDSDKGAAATTQVFNVVLILIVLDLGVKSWYTLIYDMNLVFRVSTNSTSMLFERKARG